MKLKGENKRIQLDPFPILGIQLDPKITFNKQLDRITEKTNNKINLLRKIKGMKVNAKKINLMLYKSLIRSVFDYSFIILSTSTQKISNRLQKYQNKILKILKFFNYITKTSKIHEDLKIDLLATRTSKLLQKYIVSRKDHEQLIEELIKYKSENQHSTHKRFKTP